MEDLLNIENKKGGDSVTAAEFNQLVDRTNSLIKRVSGYPEIVQLTWSEYQALENAGLVDKNKRYRII